MPPLWFGTGTRTLRAQSSSASFFMSTPYPVSSFSRPCVLSVAENFASLAFMFTAEAYTTRPLFSFMRNWSMRRSSFSV